MINKEHVCASHSERYFSLGLTFSDIPHPERCTYCGSLTQKEFLEYETRNARLIVVATPTPGYGCTGCGLKHFDPSVVVALLDGAAREFRAAGEVRDAERLETEAVWHRQTLDPHTHCQ